MKWIRFYWPIWLMLLAISFAIPEGLALATHGETLSEWVWRLSKAWPLIIFIAGLLAGGLAVHFWWQGEGLRSNDRTIKD